MPKPVVSPKHRIRGGSAKTTRAPQRVRCAYGFDGPADMLSQDLGFRTFRNHREKVTRPCSS